MPLCSGVSFLINLQTHVYLFIHWLHIFCMGEVPVKVRQFQLFLFILALEILFLLINRNPRLRNLQFWPLLPLLSIFWWYNLFLTGRYPCKTHGWYFFFLTLIRLRFLKGVFSRNGERVNLNPPPPPHNSRKTDLISI